MRPPRPLARGDVDEGAFAGVVEQAVLADAGDENVGKAVVVVVADGDAHAVHFEVEASALGDVGEGSVAIVAIEAQGWSARCLWFGQSMPLIRRMSCQPSPS